MRKLFRLTVPLFIASILFSCRGNEIKEGTKISREEAIADIDFMVDYIHATHPDMFAEYPEEDFRRKVTEVKSALPDSVGLLDFLQEQVCCRRFSVTDIPVWG